ncbi:MAG: hypothetical protein K0R92_1405 [Lachnospiraceae bacterium]|jgi:serine/threonine-protein kinase|nr:hypothetical protein [Lachnospiraceae bacterium]
MENLIWFGKYKVIKLLGRGGSSEVYLAEHIKLNVLRAIKRISKNSILHEQLLKEAHILKDLNHSLVPIIYDFEEDAHNSYIIEQYIEGQSLKMLMKQKRHIPENLIICYTIQICELLQHLYSLDNPILYLDLNPENVIIDNNTIKLIDFGAAGYKSNMNGRKYSLGTNGFAAPELYSRNKPDERTDVYGVGTLLYFMATGSGYDQVSQRKLNKHQIKPHSKELLRIIRKCLHFYPSFRYQAISALKNNLLELNKSRKWKKTNSRTSICIAVAGTSERIGTTHLAIMLTTYFSSISYKSLYIEKNDTHHIYRILKRHQGNTAKNNIYRIYGCDMIPSYHSSCTYNSADYNVTIFDYGRLTNLNAEDFLKADIKLLVSGAKEWELDETEEALKLVSSSIEVKYLYNFVEGRRFREVVKSMEGLACYRIPYEPNPFQSKYNESITEFMEELLEF